MTDITDKYKEIVRESKFIRAPWGYKRNEENPYSLLPIYEHLEILEEAFDHLDRGGTLREVSSWMLSKLPDAPLSHQGLSQNWKKARKGDKDNERLNRLKAQKKKLKPKTPEEAKRKQLQTERAAAKRAITHQTKKLNRIVQEENAVGATEEYTSTASYDPTESVSDKEQEVVFRANPGPQTDFLMASEQEVLYGGAAGGGKSYALLADAARFFNNKNFSGLLIRRTNDELRELKWKSKELYAVFKGQWKEKDSMWVFPSGARLWMTYLERDEDVLRYQGQAFTWIAVDELTQYATPFAWNYLRSRLRAGGADIECYMRATSNPGGPGHGWVKRMFIDPAPYNESFWATDIDTGEIQVDPESGEPLFKRRFIPASLKDNPYLYEGGQYRKSLLSLPEHLRRQLLDGDWDVSSGAAFPEWRRSKHTIAYDEIPKEWRRFRSCDYGYSSNTAVHWWAINPAYETLICYRELYVSKVTGEALADMILERERGEKIDYGVLDSAVWAKTGHNGPSIAEVMIAKGCRWRPADKGDGSRVAGRLRLHELLKVDEVTELPGILFMDNCRQIIADLPIIPTDPNGGEDIDKRYASDHAYDSVRYAIMSRPRSKSIFEDWGSGSGSGYKPVDAIFGY